MIIAALPPFLPRVVSLCKTFYDPLNRHDCTMPGGGLEQPTGKSVVTSDRATIWAAFHQVQAGQSISGLGRLLDTLTGQIVSS